MFCVFGRKQILISKMSTKAHLTYENIFGVVWKGYRKGSYLLQIVILKDLDTGSLDKPGV